MLPKKERLAKKKDFNAVYQKGKIYRSEKRNITLRCAKNALETVRVGFVVGKSYSKKAVERNKLKRRLRAAISENISQIQPGRDIIVSYNGSKKEGKPLEYKELLKQLGDVIKKIK